MSETIYSAEKQVLDASIQKILEERYFIKKEDGSFETWYELCDRVGSTLIPQEPFDKKYKGFTDALKQHKIMVGSPTLMNAGARLGMLSSCFIYNLEDSLEEIFTVVKDSAKTFQYGGGIGYDFSSLRPEGAKIRSTGGYSSGPMSFMKVIDKTGEVVKGGGLRKAAIMSTMRVDHPDIEAFINIKRKENELNNMNLSVTITDEFMLALKNKTSFDLRFNKKIYKTVEAEHLWDLIVDAAWQSAEPGIIFIDRVNAYNTTPAYGDITHPNPCSEFFQVAWNSCNLGSVNLMSCYNKYGEFDFKELARLTELLTAALNKTIEINNYPIKRVADVTRALRPIGIGVFGTANVFIKEQLRYGSEESCKFLGSVLDTINRASLDVSAEYAKELGSFDSYDYQNFRFLHEREDQSLWASTLEKVKKYGLYNCLTTTLMPTGTVSILAGQGESNGIEPLYSEKVRRKFVNAKGNLEEMDVYAPVIKDFIDNAPRIGWPSYIVTKDNLKPEDHIRVLAEAQKHCQTGVSKTINFPNSATRSDISRAYLLAYSMRCKSVSVYRDGSRSVQILTSEAEKRGTEVISIIETFASKTVPGQKVIFDIEVALNGSVRALTAKTEAGECLTIGKEYTECININKKLENGILIAEVLRDLKDFSESEDSLEMALHRAIQKVRDQATEKAVQTIMQVESSATFGECVTGACSL